MGIVDELYQGLQTFFDKNLDHVTSFFNTEFWGLVGYTGIAAFGCAALAYFFPVLRGVAGAVFFSLAALWYGYDRGQRSLEKPKIKSKK